MTYSDAGTRVHLNPLRACGQTEPHSECALTGLPGAPDSVFPLTLCFQKHATAEAGVFSRAPCALAVRHAPESFPLHCVLAEERNVKPFLNPSRYRLQRWVHSRRGGLEPLSKNGMVLEFGS